MEGAPSAQLFRPATLGSSLSPPLHPPHLTHQHVLCSVHLGNTRYSNRWTPDVRGLMPSKFKIGVPLGDPLQCVSPAPPTPWLCPRLKTCLVFVTPWTAAHQASLSFTISWNLLKLMSIELVMPSNRLILCCPFLLRPSSFPAPGSFPMSWLFASGVQSIGASASAPVLPMNIEFISFRMGSLASELCAVGGERWGPGMWRRFMDQAWMGRRSPLPSLHRHVSLRLAECAWSHLRSISDPPNCLHLHRTPGTHLEDKSLLTGLHSGPPSLSRKITRTLLKKKKSQLDHWCLFSCLKPFQGFLLY